MLSVYEIPTFTGLISPKDLIIHVSNSVMLDNRSERSDNFLYKLRSDEVQD